MFTTFDPKTSTTVLPSLLSLFHTLFTVYFLSSFFVLPLLLHKKMFLSPRYSVDTFSPVISFRIVLVFYRFQSNNLFIMPQMFMFLRNRLQSIKTSCQINTSKNISSSSPDVFRNVTHCLFQLNIPSVVSVRGM